jgi:hypothetical protein
MNRLRLILISFFAFFSSCIQHTQQGDEKALYEDYKDLKQPIISPDSVYSNDFVFYGDTLFPGHGPLMSFLMQRYIPDTCGVLQYHKQSLRDGFEGYKLIGDVNNDQRVDCVFVLPPLNSCEQEVGQSYYFTDATLPRLLSGSFCCHPSNFFKTADIDEDGICEVGFFYSSCASRYKSLRLFRLHQGEWQQIAIAGFDILTQDPEKVKFEELVRKTGKNSFQIRNYMEGKSYWEMVRLK